MTGSQGGAKVCFGFEINDFEIFLGKKIWGSIFWGSLILVGIFFSIKKMGRFMVLNKWLPYLLLSFNRSPIDVPICTSLSL